MTVMRLQFRSASPFASGGGDQKCHLQYAVSQRRGKNEIRNLQPYDRKSTNFALLVRTLVANSVVVTWGFGSAEFGSVFWVK